MSVKKVTKKSTKITLRVMVVFFIVALVTLSSVGIYFAVKDRNRPTGSVGNPLDWSVDEWDGESSNSDNWLDGDQFGNRGERVYTIDSVESFIYFIDLVNNEVEAQKYDNFMGYTVYLNTNIDLKGYSIESIGKLVERTNGTVYSTFQGTFDGSYYTIYNGNIAGNGLFGYVENATIKNIGLYNCTIIGEGSYVGGIVGEAINTDIENTYVRLGSINGNKVVAGIAGSFISDDEAHYIKNSFADTTINGVSTAGLIGNISADTTVTISNSYYTNQDRYNVTIDNQDNVVTTNVIKANSVSQFYSWDYAAQYNLEKTWCNYSYKEGSTELSFSYPILTRFNKVFMTGSCYENTVKNETTGEIINADTISDAFASVSDEEEAEVNVIVEQVYMEDAAVASGTSTVTLNTSVDATLVRGDSNPEMLVVGADNSTLILGDESAKIESDEDGNLTRLDNLPTLTLDGQRDYVEENGLKSGALVYAQGYDFEMYSNVVVKDNINNTTGYGGGVFINSLNVGNRTNGEVDITGGGQVMNCEADYDGGGVCVVWSAMTNNLSFNVSGCSARNGGGLAIIEDIEDNAAAVDAVTKLYGGDKYVKPAARYVVDGAVDATLSNSTYSGNSVSTYGGGAYYRTTWGNARLTLGSNCFIYSNSATYGGGVAARDNDTDSDGGVDVRISYGFVGTNSTYDNLGNSADYNGGGVYCRGSIHMTGGQVRFNSAGSYGGGLYRTNSTNNNGDDGYGYGVGSRTGGTLGGNTASTGQNTYGFGSASYRFYYRTSSYGSTYSSRTVYYYDYPSVPTATTLSAYNFYGWASSRGATATVSTSSVNTSTSGTVYRYAVYSKSITVYYDGTSTTLTTRFSYNDTTSASQTISLSSYDDARSGYLFQGWTTTSSFSNNTTSAPSKTTGTSVSQSAASATYYAVYGRLWLFYSGSGTTDIGTYYMYNVGENASYSYTGYTPTRSGYTFVGWSTSSTGTSGGTATTTEWLGGFYAVWQRSTTTTESAGTGTQYIYFNSNGGVGNMNNMSLTTYYSRSVTTTYNYNYDLSYSSSSKSYGDSYLSSYGSITLPECGFTRTGYTFSNWARGSTSGTRYNAGSSYSGASTTFYAMWDINYYYLDLNPYLDGVGVNSSDLKVGFKVGGEDLGYIQDYYQQVAYGTTWEVYGVSISNTAKYECTSGSSQGGTVTGATNVRVDFETREYWTDVNIYSPAGVQDYASGTVDIVYSTGQSYNDVTNEQGTINCPYGATITVSDIKPADGYVLDRVVMSDGSTIVDNGNGSYTYTVVGGGIICIYMANGRYRVSFDAPSVGDWLDNTSRNVCNITGSWVIDTDLSDGHREDVFVHGANTSDGGPYVGWTSDIAAGTEITYSFYARVAEGTLTLTSVGYEKANSRLNNVTLTTEWQRFDFTTTVNDSNYCAFVFYNGWNLNEQFYVKDISMKLASTGVGQTWNMADLYFTYNTAIPELSGVPTREGYTFQGYYTGENGTGTKVYNADGSRAISESSITEDTILYSYWTVNYYWTNINIVDPDDNENFDIATFDVTYNHDNSSYNDVNDQQSDADPYGTTITISDIKSKVDGLVLESVYCTGDGSIVDNGDGTYTYTILGQGTVYIKFRDVQAPNISRLTWQMDGDNGFYVYAYVTDNWRIDRVSFPTWTTANGQDDIMSDWGNNPAALGEAVSTTINGQTYNYRYYVSIADHNNETGYYLVHVYPYDGDGNRECFTLDANGSYSYGGAATNQPVVVDPEARASNGYYYATLEDAINDPLTTSGSTIYIVSDSISMGNINLTKSITLKTDVVTTVVRDNASSYMFEMDTAGVTLTIDAAGATFDGQSQSGMGFLKMYAGTFNLVSGTIQNFNGDWGGAIYTENNKEIPTVNISGGIIRNCMANGDGNQNGGAVLAHNMTMSGGMIQNCVANDNGGAIFVNAGSTFTMTGGTILNCRATNNGGAILIQSNVTANIENAVIIGCSAYSGGAIYSDDSSGTNVSIKNSTIAGSVATENGGAIYTHGNLTLENSTIGEQGESATMITDLTGWNYVYSGQANYKSWLNPSFNANTNTTTFNVYGQGGWENVHIPIYLNANVTYTFSANYNFSVGYASSAGSNGVPMQLLTEIQNSDCSSVAVVSSYSSVNAGPGTWSFSYTPSESKTYYLNFNFGVVSDYFDLTVDISNITIAASGNRSNSGDGAISVKNNYPINIIGGQFIGNYTGSAGGAIGSNVYGNITISGGVLFENNSSQTGGAIYSSGETLNISDATFNNNYSSSSGGAIAVTTTHSSNALNTIVNIADDVVFSNNSATWGGALDLHSTTESVLKTISGTFYGNIASSGGGAISTGGGRFLITDATFYNNTAQGVVGTESSDSGSGGAINIGGGTNYFTFEGTINIYNNTAAKNGGAISVSYNTDTAIISGDINIYNNTAYTGGGIYNVGTTTMSGNVNIYDNTATVTDGPQVYNNSGATFNFYSGVINNDSGDNVYAVYNAGTMVMGDTTATGTPYIGTEDNRATAGIDSWNNATLTINEGYIYTDVYSALRLRGMVNISNLSAYYLRDASDTAHNSIIRIYGGSTQVSLNNVTVVDENTSGSGNEAFAMEVFESSVVTVNGGYYDSRWYTYIYDSATLTINDATFTSSVTPSGENSTLNIYSGTFADINRQSRLGTINIYGDFTLNGHIVYEDGNGNAGEIINVHVNLNNTYNIGFWTETPFNYYFNTTNPLVTYSSGITPDANDFAMVDGVRGGATFRTGSELNTMLNTNIYNTQCLYVDGHYVATFNANGGTLTGNNSYVMEYGSSDYSSMASVIPTRSGYTFTGWYTAASGGERVYDENGLAIAGTYWANSGSNKVWNYANDVTLYAQWAAAEYNIDWGFGDGIEYIEINGGDETIGIYGGAILIEWDLLDGSAQYTYELDRVVIYGGTDDTGPVLAEYTSGTSATYVMNGTYYPNIYIYATSTAVVNTYNVTIMPNNTAYGTVSLGQLNVPYGTTVQTNGNRITIGSYTVTATANTGYHFSSWNAPNTITGTTTITAVFAPNTDTAYTVRHYWQNVDDDEYTLHETENLTGTTGAQVTPSVKTYTGFISPSTQTVTIAADGSTVVEYRYTRQTYTVNLQAGTGVTSVSGGGTYRYEKEITINAVLAEGYDWRNWTGTTTISTQQATITVTQNMTLTANADIKVLVVTITAGTGGQVSETSVEVDYGTAVSVDGATLTIGTTVVTATANSGYEFDSYLNVPETVTSNVTITAQFAEIVNVTIEVQGEVGSASYGIKVNNGETISTSGTVRKGSTINILGTTEPGDEENNVYQILTVYINDELSMRPDTGDISGNTGTIIYSVEEDTMIRFVFSEGYRMNISATEDTNVDGIDISADIDKTTIDGIIATDAEVTITIDENTLKGSNTDRTYIGMVYTLDSGETVSVLNGGDDYVHKDDISSGDGLYVYNVGSDVVIKDIHVIVRGEEAIEVAIPDGVTVEIRSEEGFVKNLQNGRNVIFTGKWYIILPEDELKIEEIFGGLGVSQETTGAYKGYYYFEL